MPSFTTLVDLLDAFGKRGDQPAVMVVREQMLESWSFAKLAGRARRVAIQLTQSGVVRQEPVAILLPNRPEWIAAYFGIVAAGATAVPLDFMSRDGDMPRMLARVGCRRMFTTAARRHQLQTVWKLDDVVFHSLDEEDGVEACSAEAALQGDVSLPAA